MGTPSTYMYIAPPGNVFGGSFVISASYSTVSKSRVVGQWSALGMPATNTQMYTASNPDRKSVLCRIRNYCHSV